MKEIKIAILLLELELLEGGEEYKKHLMKLCKEKELARRVKEINDMPDYLWM